MDKKYLKSVGISVLTVLLCVGLIAYIGYHFFGAETTNVTVAAAEKMTSEDKSEYTAYIMRTEEPIYAPSSAGVSYRYASGERVSRGSIIARLYQGADGTDIRRQLVNFDNKLSILARSEVDEGTRFVGTAIIDSQIAQTHTAMLRATAEGDIDFALQQKDTLNILLNRRKVLIGTVDGYSEQSEKYRAEEEKLIAGLGSDYTELSAERSGYFFTGVDGYETVFDASGVSTMTVDDYDAMIAAAPVTREGSYAIGKMVTDFKWYITFEIPVSDMKKYTVDSYYDIVFPYNGDTRVNMKLERMITPIDGGRCVLVLSSSEMPSNFNYLRAQTVQVIERSYSGYRVPTAAVRVIDGVRGVYILDGSTVRFKRIHVLTEVDGYIIAKKQNTLDDESMAYDLGYCDLIITGGKDLYDGKIIE